MFQQPKGAKADIAELEYVAALHQTGLYMRSDCSISAKDVSLFLCSRFGLKIDYEGAVEIVRGLSGKANNFELECSMPVGDDEERGNGLGSDPNISINEDGGCEDLPHSSASSGICLPRGAEDEYLQLIEWVSALLIPSFMKLKVQSTRDLEEVNTKISQIQLDNLQLSNKLEDSNNSALERLKVKWEKSTLEKEMHYLETKKAFFVDRNIVSCAVDAMMGTVQETEKQRTSLSPDLVRNLLILYGETITANDEVLVQEMVDIATNYSDNSKDPVTLDTEVFVAALTNDVAVWESGTEERFTTPFYDVFGCEVQDICDDNFADRSSTNKESEVTLFHAVQTSNNNPKVKRGNKPAFRYVKSVLSIDSVVDTQRSIFFSMAMWIYYTSSVAVYTTFINAIKYDIIDCGNNADFSCTLVNRIWTWLTLGAIFTFGGMFILIPSSLANHPCKVGYKRAIISIGVIAIFSIVPYTGIEAFKISIPHGADGQYTDLDKIVVRTWFQASMDVYLSFSMVLIFVMIPKNLIFDCLSHQNRGGGRKWTLSSDVTRSAETKKAATRKVHSLLTNAYEMHFGNMNAAEMYVRLSRHRTYEHVGGFIWTWSRLLSRELFSEHGIWIHSRLAVAMAGQILSFVVFIMIILYGTNDLANEADSNIRKIEASETPGDAKNFALWVMPTGQMIRQSSYTGLAVATIVGIFLILLYVPSTVSTILKLRCGLIASLQDEAQFSNYKLSADTAYYNTANMIYGLVGAQILFYLFFGGLVFLSVWDVTRENIMQFYAWFCALMVTIIIKVLLARAFRRKFFRGFFRRMPRAANLYTIAFEAWQLGIGGGILVSRLTQFLLASAFWVGRIDAPFLHRDVQLFGYKFDYSPDNYRRDILVHEAHRHPYIDSLGTMYLMRLKHGNKFCSNAGCAWRRLFVHALMPWLRIHLQPEMKSQQIPISVEAQPSYHQENIHDAHGLDMSSHDEEQKYNQVHLMSGSF